MNVVDEFYPEEILKLYYRNKLDNVIVGYKYKWKEKYTDDDYDIMKGIDYDKIYVQQNSNYDAVGARAIQIADLRLHAERRYKHLLKAKKAIKRLLDGLNGQQKRELKFYFEYPDELEEKCIELAKDFKSGREDYKNIKKLVRKCCNELDGMLL
jgi:hypothetical protein